MRESSDGTDVMSGRPVSGPLTEASAAALESPAGGVPPVGPVRLWFAALGSPIAWATHLMVMYPLVEVACRWQTSLPLYASSGLLFAVAGLAGVVSWGAVRAMRAHNGATVPRRMRFMARFGVWSAVLFLILIAGGTLPVLFDDPCQLPGRRPATLIPHL